MKRNNRRRGRRRTEKKALQYQLPHDLIIQILLRLPVKSLVRFKCVSKSWFSLISDPHFANSHFQFSATTLTRRILLMSASPTLESRSINFEASSLDDDSASVSLYPNFMLFESYSHVHIEGSCRGFLLLRCDSEQMQNHRSVYLWIWNPSTGFHRKIPLSPFSSNLDEVDKCFYGFGYDQSIDDYFLVTISYKEVNYDPLLQHLEFFSLRANTWEEIEGTQFSYRNIIKELQPAAGFLFNGAIHWFAYSPDLRENVIVAFDLMGKKLFNMHLPDDFDRLEPEDSGLWVFGKFLSIWVQYFDDGEYDENYNRIVEIWVMKEYKVDSSWTKTLVYPFDHYSPICSTKSGDIIKTNGRTQLAKYNDQGQLLERHSYFNDRHVCEVALYIESLLSLPHNEQA
ncbi:hypothetical protein TSUD_196730 [Trifolium subterraneum]|uniref:F-box domain-containing protein n=1 Tax=Trifolium subterraneum TaxID=3900 RepID=A0A2Z6NI36_TRISU|nr:hypothetical protein TSUD_196730 [Trifolium subterraneum]